MQITTLADAIRAYSTDTNNVGLANKMLDLGLEAIGAGLMSRREVIDAIAGALPADARPYPSFLRGKFI